LGLPGAVSDEGEPMRIEQLQIELRPRSNAQALDLGYALLRSHARATYTAYLALWLPLVALSAGLTLLMPTFAGLWVLLAWWCKPLIERAPLYVLSRKVFGTEVSWQEALRAWPRQLGGGMISLMTWKRLFAGGRGLYQPVYQLELARGKVARSRCRILSGKGSGTSAILFGVVCAHFELILAFGITGMIGIFMTDGSANINPFALIVAKGAGFNILLLAIYAAASAIMGPIYTACTFTLYLNRRASLEAWDLELKLRQITRPVARAGRRRPGATLPVIVALCLLALGLPAAPDARAAIKAEASATTEASETSTSSATAAASATAASSARSAASTTAAPGATTAASATTMSSAAKCPAPKPPKNKRSPSPTPAQQRVRAQLDALYATETLRGYECISSWTLKNPSKEKKRDTTQPITMPLLAAILKVLLIAGGIGLVAWLLYRYRDRLPGFHLSSRLTRATEIGGLDIRAESLPADVAAAVRALWRDGQRRAALALLYRATLSRLVSDNQLELRQGNTEGDCLRLARRAAQDGRIGSERLEVAISATSLWLAGAYADRWPGDVALFACCDAWQACFAPSHPGTLRGAA
jgi:hypothetical protein